MGMPEQPQSGMNIAPDGTVYEILEDGTIKRIGKVSPDGSFEPFGGAKEGIREKDGIIYRVVNGKEVKIGRILPNGEIETINQRIRNEAEISRNNVKIVTIVSILIAFLAILYFINAQQERKVDKTQVKQQEIAANEKAQETEAKKAEEARKAKEAEAQKAEAERLAKETEAQKAEEERKRQEAEAKKAGRKYQPVIGEQKAEPKNEWSMPQMKKATISEYEAKALYMEAYAMKDENPEEAKKKLQKIINYVDPSSKRYKKAKELLERL